MSRTVIIGIDGVPYSLMKDLSDRGVMPNFKELIKEGVFTRMRSSIPEISSVSWSSIITGKNPGEHGVYGFRDIIKGTYVVSFHDFRKLKAPAFWHVYNSKKYILINIPSTYPAQKVNGVHISGFVSPDLTKAVYPPYYLKILKEMDYRIDIDADRSRRYKNVLFRELFSTLDARMKVFKYLNGRLDWDFAMFVITGSDRLEHFLWDAYLDENNEWHSPFLEFFKFVDDVIGYIVNNVMNENDNLLIISDHGMEFSKFEINVNALLVKEGYLVLKDDRRRGYNSIKYGTKAFALEPCRIYLNREGKYPRGCVKENEVDGLIDELVNLFYDLRVDGKRVVSKVYRKEEIYHGTYVDHAPDLVVVPAEGFSFNAKLFKEDVIEKSSLPGKHNEEAFLYVRNGEGVVPDDPSVEDVIGIVHKLGGLS